MARGKPAKSSAKGAKKLPASAFAYPKSRVYPINTKARARAALSRAAQSSTKGAYATVAKKVRAKYGNAIASVGPRKGTISRPGYRRRRA
jgi:hypothetical protein